ncbi:MAG: Si-specific NAD(P)(+) transhydrogenase [Rhabdochlamydiaceae bacterium]|nr:Si-specific NAD(P)(+) transhydrogenase [Candidatus Amphrikana amoebophyrae]
MEELYADFLVIGSGPAGQKAAIQAAKLGKCVIVIDRGSYPGGECLNAGTIPSKSLREAILNLTEFYSKSYYAQGVEVKDVSVNDLNYSLHNVLNHQREMIERQFKKNDIRLVHGNASFQNCYEVIVRDEFGKETHHINAEKILIASGSSPRNPTHIPFDKDTILDSTRLLDIPALPKSIIVLGGGIIGSEYASFFAALNTNVTLVDKRDSILPYLDKEIGSILYNSLKKIGLKFVGGKEFDSIEKLEKGGVRLSFSDGSYLEADMLLYALGRHANVEGLDIENAGISLTSDGYIPVNSLFQSVVPHIFGAGDVIGGPCLASTSMEQGRLVARNAFGAKSHHFPDTFPIGIYTIPEISSCGYTEQQLQKLGYEYAVGRAYYYEIAKSQIAGNDPKSNEGLFKILFHVDTLEILGIQIIGSGATEVIHIGQVAMSFNARIDYFIDQVFNYPTYAEGYRIAALNGINKVKERS